MSKSGRLYDVVVFGATGFTGKCVVEYLYSESEERKEGDGLRWAIAGRSKPRLEALLQKGKPEPQVIVADVKNPASLEDMASKAVVVINCVGPFRFYGEPVVAACVSNGANYVDITGEPEFMEKMVLKYHEDAKKAGVLVVSACGFDSIPADIGAHWSASEARKDGAQVNSVVSYLTTKNFKGHYATFESAVHGFANAHKLKKTRREIASKWPVPLPITGTKLKLHKGVHTSPNKKYSVPFPGSDASVVRRSMVEHARSGDVAPFQYGAYVEINNAFWTLVMVVMGTLFGLLASFKIGRWVLLKFPTIFTFGMLTHAGPTAEERASTTFDFEFYTRSYSKGASLSGKPDQLQVTHISGRDPGYGLTAAMVAQSALCIAHDRKVLPMKAGVVPPGAALFCDTFIERLKHAGLKFSKGSSRQSPLK